MGQSLPVTMMKLILLLFCFTHLVHSTCDCTLSVPDWIPVCSTNLIFSNESQTGIEAKRICEGYGGHLVDMDSLVKNFCILKYHFHSQITDGHFWHSGNDKDAEGVYVLSNGDIIPWTPYWSNENPDEARGANCVGVSLTKDKLAGKWWDQSCTSPKYRYICEK